MKNARVFFVKSEPAGFIASRYISTPIYCVLRSEQAIFDDHLSENPNRKGWRFF